MRFGKAFDNRALLLCLWAHQPFDSVSCDPTEFRFLYHLAQDERVAFRQTVATNVNTVAALALFMSYPQLLDTVRHTAAAELCRSR